MPLPFSTLERPVALVGMMGAGKTTVGRLLAERIGLPFHDSDEAIERQAGRSVTQLFDKEGDPAFRARERLVVAQLLDRGTMILATGGGSMADGACRTLLLECSVTIWLVAHPRVLARRLAGCADRPLLGGPDRERALAALHRQRLLAYEQADFRIETDDLNPRQVAEAALAALGAFLSRG